MDNASAAKAFRAIAAMAPAIEAAVEHLATTPEDAFAHHDAWLAIRCFNEVFRDAQPFTEDSADRFLAMASNAAWDASSAINGERDLPAFRAAIRRLQAALLASDAWAAYNAAPPTSGPAVPPSAVAVRSASNAVVEPGFVDLKTEAARAAKILRDKRYVKPAELIEYLAGREDHRAKLVEIAGAVHKLPRTARNARTAARNKDRTVELLQDIKALITLRRADETISLAAFPSLPGDDRV